MTKVNAVIGARFGRLIVEGEAGRKNGMRYVMVKCDCGEVKAVQPANLTSGATISCGCFNREHKESIKKNVIGKRYGRLVVEADSATRNGDRYVTARCDCGEVRSIKLRSITAGRTKSCGCLHSETAASLNKINVVGHRYGRLVVEAEAEKNVDGVTRVVVLCDCGTRKVVRLESIRRGATTSCGCRNLEVARELMAKRSVTHGMSKTTTYAIWLNMWARCTNKNNPAYPDYGGRGITVCERWQTFENFLSDMGERPRGMSIDRRNNNLGYEPRNCHWLSQKGQARNTRANLIIEFQGITACLAEHCERLGFVYGTVSSRIRRGGWSAEKALSTPVRAPGVRSELAGC